MHSTLERSPTNKAEAKTEQGGKRSRGADPRAGLRAEGCMCGDVPCVSPMGMRSQGIGWHLPTQEDSLMVTPRQCLRCPPKARPRRCLRCTVSLRSPLAQDSAKASEELLG